MFFAGESRGKPEVEIPFGNQIYGYAAHGGFEASVRPVKRGRTKRALRAKRFGREDSFEKDKRRRKGKRYSAPETSE